VREVVESLATLEHDVIAQRVRFVMHPEGVVGQVVLDRDDYPGATDPSSLASPPPRLPVNLSLPLCSLAGCSSAAYQREQCVRGIDFTEAGGRSSSSRIRARPDPGP
jgi:hypothetical protein